jgi:hypothetical protein
VIPTATHRDATEAPAGLEPLVRVAAKLARVPYPETAATTAGRLVPQRGGAGPRWRSTLNNDGSPLQVCVTASARGVSVRLLADPGSHADSPSERVALARAALGAVLSRAEHADLREPCLEVLETVTPAPLEAEPAAAGGVLWLGAPVRGTGLALYVKARWRSAGEDWDRCAALAERLLPDPSAALAVVRRLRGHAHPVSAGLELNGRGGRLKLYWRPQALVALADTGVELLADQAFAGFVQATIGERAVPAEGLVLSAGFALESGALRDAKLDICAHCVPRPPDAWDELIGSLAAVHRLEAPPRHDVLGGGLAEVAFLGLGLDRDGERRLNVYLKRAGEPAR